MKNTRLKQIDRSQQFMLEFYDKYSAFLFHCAWKYTSSHSDCEDIVQDALIRLLRNLDTLRSLTENQTFTYLSLTVRSVYADKAKAMKEQEIPTDDETLSRLRSGQAGEDWTNVKWDVEILRGRLPEKDWRLLELKYIAGFSDSEIAAELGYQTSSVRQLLLRARQRARAILSNDERKDG